jgi:hypothetical protein
MSDETTPESEKAPELVEPAAEPTVAETAAATEVVPAEAEPVPVTAVPVEPAEPVAATPEPVAPAPAHHPHQVIYVETPVPPRPRGNRVAGVLLALVGAVVFGVLFALVGGLLDYFRNEPLFGDTFTKFVLSAAFWVPILVFALAFILLVVIVNRGGWAAHVFGSLLLAFVVYFASIGLLLLVAQISGSPTTFGQIALYPQIIAAAVIAREVAIWFGLGISSRGRRVKVRNADDRAKYDQELAEKRAQYERPQPASQPTQATTSMPAAASTSAPAAE